MIRNVVSHTWRRKGFSSLMLELSPVLTSDTQVLLSVRGRSEDSTPYLIAASAAVSPLHGNYDGSALQDCVLEGCIMTGIETTVMLLLQPSHRFLRLDCIGRLATSLERIFPVEDKVNGYFHGTKSQAAEAASLAFDHVTHHVTVALDVMRGNNVSPGVDAAERSPSPHVSLGGAARRERLNLNPEHPTPPAQPPTGHNGSVLDSPIRRLPFVTSKPQPTPPLSDRLRSLSPRRGAQPSAAPGSRTESRRGRLRDAHKALLHRLAQIEEEVAWYQDKAMRWASQRQEYLCEIRGGGSGVVMTPAVDDSVHRDATHQPRMET